MPVLVKNNKNTNIKKMITVFAVVAFFVIAIFATSLTLIHNKIFVTCETEVIEAHQMASDPTKLNLPDWINILMQVALWLVVAFLSIGIICFAIYIIVYFIKRRYGKTFAYIDDTENEEKTDDSPNLVRVTIGEEVIDEKQN